MVINVQHSTLRFARNSTSASPTIQHSTFNTQHCRRLQFTIDQLTIAGVSREQFNIQHSKLNIQIGH